MEAYGGAVCCMLNAALFSSADISIFLSLLIRMIVQNNQPDWTASVALVEPPF